MLHASVDCFFCCCCKSDTMMHTTVTINLILKENLVSINEHFSHELSENSRQWLILGKSPTLHTSICIKFVPRLVGFCGPLSKAWELQGPVQYL